MTAGPPGIRLRPTPVRRRRHGAVGAVLAALVLLGGLQTNLVAQRSVCRQVLARAAVATGTYGVVGARPFEGRVFVYVPPAQRTLQVWIIEGVYGRPFVRASGPLSASDFAALRSNRNIRATRVAVNRADGSEGATVRVGSAVYGVVVTGASRAGVQVLACGP